MIDGNGRNGIILTVFVLVMMAGVVVFCSPVIIDLIPWAAACAAVMGEWATKILMALSLFFFALVICFLIKRNE